MTGPEARPTACAAACTPSAALRVRAGTLVTTSATLLACSSAAPAAWTTRSAISAPSEGASPHAAEAPANTTNPYRYMQLAAGPVRPAAGRDQQRGQRQQVGERHPLDGREPGAELPLQRGEGHRDDARVELAHERAEAHRGDREPRRERVLADHRGPRRLAQQAPRVPRAPRDRIVKPPSTASLILNLLQNYY